MAIQSVLCNTKHRKERIRCLYDTNLSYYGSKEVTHHPYVELPE